MSVVVWARVSSREQREGYSIDAQLRMTRDRAQSLGWQISREFVVTESAKRGAERTAFNEIFAWVRANAKREKIKAILNYSPQERQTAGFRRRLHRHLPVPHALRKCGDPAHPRARLKQGAADAQRDRIEQIRRTIARPVIAERVHALVGQLEPHLVRQNRDREEEMGAGGKRL